MKNNNLIKIGSQTAKNGFKNEKNIASKFDNWRTDPEAKLWLHIMGYDFDEIKNVKAVIIPREKTDVQVQIEIEIKDALSRENLQVKLVSTRSGFNQVDKRWVDKYAELWSIPENIILLLKHFTGEMKPNIDNPKDSRRMFLDEFTKENRQLIINFFSINKPLIVNDILRGRGPFAAEWILVAQKITSDARWVLKPMNIAINHFSSGNVELSPHGSLKIGSITVQRKGGDGGRATANMLQCKIDPAKLFDI